MTVLLHKGVAKIDQQDADEYFGRDGTFAYEVCSKKLPASGKIGHGEEHRFPNS